MKTMHTPEPWKIGTPPPNGEQTIGTAAGLMVAVTTTGHSVDSAANARRIVACVNYCAGAETSGMEFAVERGETALSTMSKLADRQHAAEQQRDRAERALRAAGWTYEEGAAEWKPPLGPSSSPLLERIDQLEAQRDHWKANHENQVRRARILIERTDMPIERVSAYNRMLELEQQRDQLLTALEELRDFYQDCTGLPACAANAAIATVKGR